MTANKHTLWYLDDGREGVPGEILTQEEVQNLRSKQREGRLYTLSAALREGKIHADMSEDKDINKLDFYVHKKSKKEGEKGEKKFLTNKLREKIQEKKKKKKTSSNKEED